MDLVENYPKMSHLLKKLAFAEVYILVSNNQVTLHSYKYLPTPYEYTKQEEMQYLNNESFHRPLTPCYESFYNV